MNPIPRLLMRVPASDIRIGETFYMAPLNSKKLRAYNANARDRGELIASEIGRPRETFRLCPGFRVFVPFSLKRHDAAHANH